MLLQDVFPNHGEDIIPNCTDKSTLKNVQKTLFRSNKQVPYVKLTSHQVIQVDRHSTVGHH